MTLALPDLYQQEEDEKKLFASRMNIERNDVGDKRVVLQSLYFLLIKTPIELQVS